MNERDDGAWQGSECDGEYDSRWYREVYLPRLRGEPDRRTKLQAEVTCRSSSGSVDDAERNR